MNVTSFLILIIGLFFFQSVFFILRKIIKNKLYKGIVVTNPLIRIKKNENSGVNEGLVDYQWTIIISFIFLIGTLLIFLIVLNFGSGSTLVLDIFFGNATPDHIVFSSK